MELAIQRWLATGALLWCSALVCHADEWSINGEAAPLEWSSAEVHEITIRYQNACGVDVDSLDGNDVVVSRQRLFQPLSGRMIR